jgi:circadian clock protein KaiC
MRALRIGVAPFHLAQIAVRMVDLVPTGVSGLDELLGGGLVAGTMALVEGAPGTGKTTLGLQFVHYGCAARGEPGLVLTFEETPQQLYRDAVNFGWDLRRLVQEGKLDVICITPDVLERYLDDPDGMWERLTRGARPQRVLIDSLTNLRQLTNDEVRLRHILNVMLSGMRRRGMTALLLSEMEERGGESIPFEEYVVDAVIRLVYATHGGDGLRRRYLEILKTRGQQHQAGRHSFKFMSDGLRVFPPLQPRPIELPYDDRRAYLGVAAFDQLLGTGVPAPAQVMLIGDTGVGKTVSSLHFIHEGLQCGERCVFVDCDEVPAMTRHTLAHFGIATMAHEHLGRLRFVDAYGREGTREGTAVTDPSDLDEFLSVEDRVLDEMQADRAVVRVCVDSMSTLVATSSYQAAIDFVAAHLRNLRARQIVSLDTYTSGVVEPRLMANITQHYDVVISMRFAEIHGTPIRLGAVEKYRFGAVGREEQIFSVEPGVGIVSHRAALRG